MSVSLFKDNKLFYNLFKSLKYSQLTMSLFIPVLNADCVPIYPCISYWLCPYLSFYIILTVSLFIPVFHADCVPIYPCISCWLCPYLWSLYFMLTVSLFSLVFHADCVPIFPCISCWLCPYLSLYFMLTGALFLVSMPPWCYHWYNFLVPSLLADSARRLQN